MSFRVVTDTGETFDGRRLFVAKDPAVVSAYRTVGHTRQMFDGRRLLVAVDCSGTPAHRVVSDTGQTFDGRRLFVAETSPCGAPTVVVSCCTEAIPQTLYATFGGVLAGRGTITLTWATDRWTSGTITGCNVSKVELFCVFFAGAWRFKLAMFRANGNIANEEYTVATSCNPILIEHTFSYDAAFTAPCAGSGLGTATATTTGTPP